MNLSVGPSSFRRALLFWWILLVLLQQVERLFLLQDTLALEVPTADVLMRTLVIGLRGDFITATMGIALAAALAGVTGLWLAAAARVRRKVASISSWYSASFRIWCCACCVGLMALLVVDMGYYGYNQQHLDFVFFEYIGDLLSPIADQGTSPTEALRETHAELRETQKWAGRASAFIVAQLIAIVFWVWCFKRMVEPALDRWRPRSSARANLVLAMCLAVGATGFHPQGSYGIRVAEIGNSSYYTLAQNPILYAGEALRVALLWRYRELSRGLTPVPSNEALRLTQELFGDPDGFPDPRFPLVREMRTSEQGVRLKKPANVLLIFIEGLDRRYLGRTIREVRVTPFLDRLKTESVFFENFFANGVETSRGLFASFCSYYPRHGASAMKTRYAHDYLCLPSLLRKGGYRTEMVIGQHRDLNRLQLFMSRNGLHQLFAEGDFPPQTELSGLGVTDGALLEFVRSRIEALQGSQRPFFVATLTVGTHRPFVVPGDHPDVRVLQEGRDRYPAALRYADLELDRFFSGLRRDGLLNNTVVFLLGDHGRHEAVGRTSIERQIGHFASPLFIWMDESLRSPSTYRPRVVSMIASQVDLAPTILAVNGLTPRVAPFLGRDISCSLVVDCLADNVAYLSSIYDDLIALADRGGILLYLRRTKLSYQTNLAFTAPTREAREFQALGRLLALHESTNWILDQNRIWSWKELGGEL